MIVTIHTADGLRLVAAGPRDLYVADHSATILVSGPADRERDFGRWSGALGAAVLRGACVRRCM